MLRRVHALLEQLSTLRDVQAAGMRTWMFVAPVLPMNPDALVAAVLRHIEYALVDARNYRQQAPALFRRHGWGYAP